MSVTTDACDVCHLTTPEMHYVALARKLLARDGPAEGQEPGWSAQPGASRASGATPMNLLPSPRAGLPFVLPGRVAPSESCPCDRETSSERGLFLEPQHVTKGI